MTTTPVSGEALFQQGQNQERLNNYSDAIQLYERVVRDFTGSSYAVRAREAIPRCYYNWGLYLEENGQYSGSQSGGAIERYSIILENYPESMYAAKLTRLTTGDPRIETIVDASLNVTSGFYASITNESSHYIVQVNILVLLYFDANLINSQTIEVNGIEPGKEKEAGENSFVPTLHDDYEWSITEVWLREV